MERSFARELLDADGVDEDAVTRSYREIGAIHRWLGDTALLLRLLRLPPRPQRVLDIGCGRGALLAQVRDELRVDVVGIDVRPAPADASIPILAGDAVTDPLPGADVALCVAMAHHLTETELSSLIVNVSRSCRRLILLDLVRHWAPLVLFRVFIAPLLSRVSALDGVTSIRRAYTPAEMRQVVADALHEAQRPVSRLRHTVGPFWIRQVVDIAWSEEEAALNR